MGVFSNSPTIRNILERLGLLEVAAGFDIEGIDITNKINKPAAFAAGDFCTFNVTTGNIEETGKNAESFVPAEEGKGLSTNDFTDEHRTIVENLGEVPDFSTKMDKVVPTAGNLGNIGVIDAEGNMIDSGKKPGGFFTSFSQALPADFVVPGMLSFGTVPITPDVTSVFIIYTLSVDNVPSRKRSASMLLLMVGTDTPVNVGQIGGDTGSEISGEVTFTIQNDILMCNYDISDANFGTRINLQILTI